VQNLPPQPECQNRPISRLSAAYLAQTGPSAYDAALMDAHTLDLTRRRILQKYGLSPDSQISRGMEAEVYAYGADSVLKLYAGTAALADLQILKDFYDSLAQQPTPYQLPHIHTVTEEEGCLVTTEQRLAGTKLSSVLPSFSAQQVDEVMERYLTAALALSNLQVPPTFNRYKLFDPDHLSQPNHGDWHQFLWCYSNYKLVQLAPFFKRDVSGFATKLGAICAVLDQPYTDDYHLIHGDYFPGNLLINEEHEITTLLDFGLFTLRGDYLFDIATGWVFFDMYNELKVGIRDRYLKVVINRLGEGVRGKLYRYVLIYSLLSADTYSPDCTDGHYQWCVANLNNQEYWDKLN
jgi:Phosphotransferase enzyme family